MDVFSTAGLTAFIQVILIDLVLAGDNAIVIGLAAAGLPPDLRRKAILIGIAAATIMRIMFAVVATQLLAITGLLLAGGLLLLWVCWKMWQELRGGAESAEAPQHLAGAPEAPPPQGKTLGQAVGQIVVADVSMSLDNVLAVAGAAQHHFEALIFGLALSVVLMGVASAAIANLLGRHRWIAWVGLLVIFYVAVRMIYEGADTVFGGVLPDIPLLSGAHAPAPTDASAPVAH